ncbi:MAG: fructosamine kinase family protein, partial [Pseudomonadota bacterium]
MPDWRGIFADLGRQGVAIDPDCVPTSVGGGNISAAWRLSGSPQVFVKTGGPEAADMFVAEAEGLAEIAASQTLRVPRVLATGCSETHAWLALEWLSLDRTSGNAGARLGEGLAAMHRVTQELHGWHRDNTIGSTPQANLQCDDWCKFFRERRLRPQFALAAANGFGGRL